MQKLKWNYVNLYVRYLQLSSVMEGSYCITGRYKETMLLTVVLYFDRQIVSPKIATVRGDG